MELQHFSHEHPLILTEGQKDAGKEVLCYGCQKSILGSENSYRCSSSSSGCDFFLHKTCAEAPKQIQHPVHPQHPLTFFACSPYSYSACICNNCRNVGWKWFTYHCSHCEFDVCMSCAFFAERTVEHKSHHHPLTVVQREALCYCDACGTKAEDFSYLCTTCPFWIHKSCASSPSTIEVSDKHKHPLVLAYSLPDTYRTFDQICYVCKTKVQPSKWVYYCARCRYFVHMKCVTSKPEPLELSSGTQSEIKTKEGENEVELHLPMRDDQPMDLIISQFVKAITLGDDDDDDKRAATEQINHFSHDDHPLMLYDVLEANNSDERKNIGEIFCRGCMLPILSTAVPFYGCDKCNFFLHKSCAELPRELLQHNSHPEHPLRLIKLPRSTDICQCNGCRSYCNGFAFACESCKFYLDIRCSTLPKSVKHEAHNHPLFQTKGSESSECNACGYLSSGIIFRCDSCGFFLHNLCALLPRFIKHRWDEHPIPLTYPPISDHPDAFYCEICEEEINPRYWLYHCRDCDQSFHTECVHAFDGSNVKYTIEVDDHPHTLTYVPKRINNSLFPCNRCGKREKCWEIVECTPCNFHLCMECTYSDRPF